MFALRMVFLFTVVSSTSHAFQNPCAAFQDLVKSTYNFKPSKVSKSEQSAKSAEMDKVWKAVRSKPKELLPCLTSALEDASADRWFLFDGSGLLSTLDHSPTTNQLVLRGCERVDLNDVDLAEWVHRLIRLAIIDVNISLAAGRWMNHPDPWYSLPQHSFIARKAEGAFFLYASMDEAQATPALIGIASDVSHPARAVAVRLLLQQATPEAVTALRNLDLSSFSSDVRSLVQKELRSPTAFQPRRQPKTTRAVFVAAFQAITRDDFGPFMDLVEEIPDGERDVVAVMTREDLPLIRKVRRRLAATGNPHQMEMYPYFTGIINTLVATNPA